MPQRTPNAKQFRSTATLAILACLFSIANSSQPLLTDEKPGQPVLPHESIAQHSERPIIDALIISGNTVVAAPALRTKIPFAVGDRFDEHKAAQIIKAIYKLGYFTNVQVIIEQVAPQHINLVIKVTEKDRISALTFEGNNNYSSEKLAKKLEASRIKTLDEHEINNIAEQIKRAYREKNFHHVKVDGSLVETDNGTYKAHFIITEGMCSRVRKVEFKGNNHISDGALRAKIFTREDWLLSFMDRAGTFHPEALLQDRYTIENYYQSRGYLTARVTDTLVDEHEDGTTDITFVINEGDLYTISAVHATGNNLLSEEDLLRRIPLCTGQLYSKELIRTSMENLKTAWGEFGYIYADVQPLIKPDEATKTVDISFRSDLGNCIHVNRIDIVGNTKTIDKVIRRELLFDEGDTLTKYLMDESKRRVQLLGYFTQPDGVIWRIIKKDDEHADLELIVKEANTGRIFAELGYGAQPDPTAPTGAWNLKGGITDSNFQGQGIRYGLSGTYSGVNKTVEGYFGNDWMFDRPISGGINGFVRETIYEDFRQTTQEPVEHLLGGTVNTGFRLEKYNFVAMGMTLGFEQISFKDRLIARNIDNPSMQGIMQAQINRTFQPGTLLWLDTLISQDFRDHPFYPNTGYIWNFDIKIGIPTQQQTGFGFVKIGLDGSWYTPLIEQYGLTLRLHGFAGAVIPMQHHAIPYRELYHIGGPLTVRGFLYGQVGPQLLGSSLGGTKALVTNVELQVPIASDGNIRGFMFYDGGASWDTPNASDMDPALLYNNTFGYRHAVGIGISLERPTAMRIDWGFKLDRKKRRGESLYEVHFGMTRPF